jgi:membrane-bound lytic murein transglycosylase B
MRIKHLILGVGAVLVCLVCAPVLLIFLLVAGAAPPVGANAAPGDTLGDIPPVAMEAYAGAAARIGTLVGGCVVPAPVLMAIGEVESGHATTPVIGPALDGSIPGTATVADTDGGALDGDPIWDHAVGAMQILPSTWRRWGQDANGDGVADPQDYADAALTAAVILCQPPADLRDPDALAAALHRYNDSDAYVADVLASVGAYAATPAPVPVR